MTEEKIKENAKRFDRLLLESRRYGIEQLIGWMHEAGFYEAPASARYHLAEPGGLLQHSLNVWECYEKMAASMMSHDEFVGRYDSAVICCLLHDLCKVGLYTQEDGQYEYNKVVGDEGHGIRSITLAARYIQLTPDESEAIDYHMGLWDRNIRKEIGDVYRLNPLAWWIHAADEAATFIIEKY